MKNKQYLIERVVEEATALKQFATKEELSKIDADIIDPFHTDLCIYGQMTGDCHSERASHLFHACAVKGISKSIMNCDELPPLDDHELRFTELNTPNGIKISKSHFSPIEVFIAHAPRIDLEHLVDFLQDRINDGELNYYDFQFFHD